MRMILLSIVHSSLESFEDTMAHNIPEWLEDLDRELSDNLESINQSYADVTFEYADQLVRIDNSKITGIAPKFTLEQAISNFSDAAIKYKQMKDNVYKNLISKYENKIECFHTNKYDACICGMITHKELIDALIAPLYCDDM